MRVVPLLSVFVLLFAGCGADDSSGSSAAHDTGSSADAPERVGDAGECVGEGCLEAVCSVDADCAPVYDEGCTCTWMCFPAGEMPAVCPGLIPCPEAEPNTTLACACDDGQCVSSAATP